MSRRECIRAVIGSGLKKKSLSNCFHWKQHFSAIWQLNEYVLLLACLRYVTYWINKHSNGTYSVLRYVLCIFLVHRYDTHPFTKTVFCSC